MLKSKKLLIVILILAGLALLSLSLRTDYVLISGSAKDLRTLVTVEGADPQDQGKFFLVMVTQRQARLLHVLWGFLHPHLEVQRQGETIPLGMDEDEYRQLLLQWMRESKLLAQVIALRRSGYQVDIVSEGIIVEGFLDESPSRGILQRGDVIIAVDGTRVSLTDEVIRMVQNRQVGEAVRLTILREDEELEPVITTVPHPDNPTQPALGIYIRALHWEPVLPVEVQLQTGQIGGPSAGMMFVLEIMNQLSPEDLTGGRLIAGTGTIDLNENVGRIGGVYQKVIAAEQAGAEFFIVPEDNYEEAVKAARRIELVPVTTLQEVIDFLDNLRSPQARLSPVYETAFPEIVLPVNIPAA